MSSVRRVVTTSPHRRVGFISSPWFQPHQIEYESLLERDFVRLALLDLRVSSITHQPFQVELDESHSYTPDFLLTGKNLRLVVEVKPEERANKPTTADGLRQAKKIFNLQGYEFLIATETLIRANKRHERAAILLRHARAHLPRPVIVETLRVAALSTDGISIGALASTAGVPIATVLHLIGRRRLRLNSILNFDASQTVYPVGDENGHLCA
ncbi:TnsA endonuclease N-terminal domain-containing protein [Paraburkholderia caledonica]|uniref:TnsA endonuclease N-terminal domain-containing protein n=1 Tax=Paraburkholderia caledonica TaxID=134536 RepID=UPI000B4024B0|nr:TnsA endonuclease N-terminal domain-containing protein [Paraburkholderia caledonica]